MTIGPAMPWRSVTIEEVLDQAAEPLVKRGLATPQRGASEKAIQAADKRLGRPLPDELRAFYRRVTPVPECPAFGLGSVGFQPVEDPDLTWLDDPELREEKLWVVPLGKCWLKGWAKARLLVIGYTEFGDWLLWCEGLSGRPAGTVVLTDHEGEDNPVVLGDAFAQWLGRYFRYGLIEYAIAEGGLDTIEPAVAEAFLRDHLRLNPRCKWAEKRLKRIQGR
jgi:SMI1 / KNR4 family (SUKH-1)